METFDIVVQNLKKSRKKNMRLDNFGHTVKQTITARGLTPLTVEEILDFLLSVFRRVFEVSTLSTTFARWTLLIKITDFF